MNPNKQRVAIAEICGWKIELYIDAFEGGSGRNRWKQPNGKWYGYWEDAATVEQLPDYLNDLNAIREAESILSKEPYTMGSKGYDYDGYILDNFGPRATAAQRAEAFLKVFGKWEEE